MESSPHPDNNDNAQPFLVVSVASSSSSIVGNNGVDSNSDSLSSSGNWLFSMVRYLKDSVSRTVVGFGELWSNHGRCNSIRSKIKFHRAKIRDHWEELGLFQNPQYTPRELNDQLNQITGGITYEEYAFLQKGKEDRSKVLNLLFLVFGAPRFLPYMLMFNPEMLPSPLQPPPTTSSENFFEKTSRERASEIINVLLKLEKDAREIPPLAKLNILGRKQQQQRLADNDRFNQQALDFLENHFDRRPSSAGAKQLLLKLQPYLIKTSEDFSRSEKRLCQVPPCLVQGLVHCLVGKGYLTGFSPLFFTRGRLLGHLKRIEEADRFLIDSKIDLTTIGPRLLRAACGDRMIGGPAVPIPELRESLSDWLLLLGEPPASAQKTAEEMMMISRNNSSSSNHPVVYYNENLARVALLSYFGMHGVRDSRNRQAALPRSLFANSSSSSGSNP